MGLFSSITKGVGKILNNVTGATSAAKESQNYALESATVNNQYQKELAEINNQYQKENAKINNQYQKEFAQNAHSWEMQDLKKAGINPIITAMGGNGASASGGGSFGGSASGGGVSAANVSASGINPVDAVINTLNGIQSAKKTGAETANVEANTLNTQTDTIGKGILNKISEIDLGYKSKMNKAELDKKKQELKNLQSQYDKLVEETNKLKGGASSTVLGTWFNDIFEKNDNNKGKDPNKPNLFSNRKGEQPIRFKAW